MNRVLVAIMNSPTDFDILKRRGWYRIPVDTAPKRWPPDVLAFYQTKVFDEQAFAIHYYGRVREIRQVGRRDLFPDETPNAKSNRRYYQVFLERLEALSRPIISARWRRIVFVSTSWEKLALAEEINDLFDDSPLEDRLWKKLKNLHIAAERQWRVKLDRAIYFLDFAMFCHQGRIAVETDGLHHTKPKRVARDYKRDNALQLGGWEVLRFSGNHVRAELDSYCIPKIVTMIDQLGGLSHEGLLPQGQFVYPAPKPERWVFVEAGPVYDWD